MPNVHLTAQMTEYVETQIESGAYANISEVVRAGIRALMQQDGAGDYYRLRAELGHAMYQVDAGRTVAFDVDDFLTRKHDTAA